MLFVGGDWAEEHHDIEVQDESGEVLAKKRLPEGLSGMVAFHELLARHVPAGWAGLEPAEAAASVVIGIETDRGAWVAALVAAGQNRPSTNSSDTQPSTKSRDTAVHDLVRHHKPPRATPL